MTERYALQASDGERTIRAVAPTLEKTLTMAVQSLWFAWPNPGTITVLQWNAQIELFTPLCVLSLPEQDAP